MRSILHTGLAPTKLSTFAVPFILPLPPLRFHSSWCLLWHGDFTYDSGSIQNILDSIRPDVTVFTGAFDANYTWKYPRQDAVNYLAELSNILAALMMKRGRFLYFSSQEIFVEVIDNTLGTGGRQILNGDRFKEEFGRKIFNHYDTGVKQVAAFMKRHSESFLTEDDAGGGYIVKTWHNLRRILKALFPFLENLVCFLLVLLLNQWVGNGEFLARLDLYLLYVLLFALVYGQQQAIVSSFLAVVGYIVIVVEK